ncbi:PLCX1 protein, partial [Nothocercus julius]|nr:PLCX1 protein [Nothocercus julius]
GSHDTMTYCLDKTSAVSDNESKLVNLLNKCLPCIIHPIIMKWSTTQELSVTEQLEAGVRYLDLRIAHKANDPSMNLYFVHMLYTTVTVQDILCEVLKWLESHPQEVVILACRNFDGLTRSLHCHLVARIKEIFRCKLCPRNVSVRSFSSLSFFLGDETNPHTPLWRRELLACTTRDTLSSTVLSEFWKKKKKFFLIVLPKKYLRCHFLIFFLFVSERFFVAGINLTENLAYILAHPFGSLKKMTLQNLPYLKIWVKQQYPGPKKECINIIAGDFIGNNDFVKDVIELNKKI